MKRCSEIFNLAIESSLTVYDSAYIWLSKKLNAKLITADEKLRRKNS